uniref:BED-type domain-containing protein n=1 Tax=Myripristis murdjan TaxID=586833 RepID=A0A667WIJ4_9TELE
SRSIAELKMAPRKRSVVWNFFRVKDEEGVECLLCMLYLIHKGHTTSMLRHLRIKHPAEFASLGGTMKKTAPGMLQRSEMNTTKEATVVEENCSVITKSKLSGRLYNTLAVPKYIESEIRVFERERELIEALRSAQKEEARALEHQRELLEMLRVANAREAAAEREKIEFLRRAQEEESRDLSRQREELQRDREELERQQRQLQHERDEFCLLSREQQTT